MTFTFLSNTLLRCIQPPCGFNVLCSRPITGAERSYKVGDGSGSLYHAIFQFARGTAITSVATHLTLTNGFPYIRLNEPRGCIGSPEPLADCQRHSPQELIIMHCRGSNAKTFNCKPSKPPLHHQPKSIQAQCLVHVLPSCSWHESQCFTANKNLKAFISKYERARITKTLTQIISA